MDLGFQLRRAYAIVGVRKAGCQSVLARSKAREYRREQHSSFGPSGHRRLGRQHSALENANQTS
jgi:hypothetical protein